MLSPPPPLGAQLHRGHGGEDPQVGERAPTVPGVGSRGAQLLAAALQRAGGPSQGRLQLGSLLQDPQPALGRVGWVALCVSFFYFFFHLFFLSFFFPAGVGPPQKPIASSPSLRVAPIVSHEGRFPHSTHNTPHSHVHWVEAKPTEICYYGFFTPPPSPN